MINFENTLVSGWEPAIRGMRNPMNSWNKSDSFEYYDEVGQEDLRLMRALVQSGSDHSKFMRMINVTVDVTAPLYWWKEFDTYKVGTVRNSCSTMHKIASKEFTLEDFSYEKLTPASVTVLNNLIDVLNDFRKEYKNTSDKLFWWQLIQLLPSSYNQRATIQMNYAVLRNMYHSRRNHKLDEWSKGFTEWVEKLPHSDLITMTTR